MINLGIEDRLLKFLQRCCLHPEQLVVTNKNVKNMEIAYCERCGAFRKNFVIGAKILDSVSKELPE